MLNKPTLPSVTFTMVLALGITILTGNLTANAETIRVPVGSQDGALAVTAKPIKGMNKNQVAIKYGEPLEKRPARGEPPISSWVYENFTVFFESDYVIHSVLRHTPKTDEVRVIKEEIQLAPGELPPEQ